MRKILPGAFVLVLGGPAFWPSTRANSAIVHEESNKMASVTKTDAQSGKNTAEQQKKIEEESPFVCNMTALDADGRRRHKVVMDQMKAATKEVKELPDGYAFRFQAEQSTILIVSEFIARERLCCPFFTFELVSEREHGPLWLRLRGREGVKDFIKAELRIK